MVRYPAARPGAGDKEGARVAANTPLAESKRRPRIGPPATGHAHGRRPVHTGRATATRALWLLCNEPYER